MIEIIEMTDIDTLMEMRMEVIDCVFEHPSPDAMRVLAAANREYYTNHLRDGSHLAYMAYDGDLICGCGAICMHDEMPSPDNVSGKCAYLMNIYVRPTHRHQGIASHIVDHLVEKAKSLGAGKIYLEATDMAYDLYRGLGFYEMDNMMKYGNDRN